MQLLWFCDTQVPTSSVQVAEDYLWLLYRWVNSSSFLGFFFFFWSLPPGLQPFHNFPAFISFQAPILKSTGSQFHHTAGVGLKVLIHLQHSCEEKLFQPLPLKILGKKKRSWERQLSRKKKKSQLLKATPDFYSICMIYNI